MSETDQTALDALQRDIKRSVREQEDRKSRLTSAEKDVARKTTDIARDTEERAKQKAKLQREVAEKVEKLQRTLKDREAEDNREARKQDGELAPLVEKVTALKAEFEREEKKMRNAEQSLADMRRGLARALQASKNKEARDARR